jgi:hypothetical protein
MYKHCSRLERFYIGEKYFFSCVVNFNNAGVVTRDRRIELEKLVTKKDV